MAHQQRRRLGNQIRDWLGTFDANETLVETTVEIAESIRIESQLIEDGCMDSFDVRSFFHSIGTEFVRLPVAHTAFDAAAGQPHCEPVSIVVAAGSRSVFGSWLASKLAAAIWS